MSDFIILGGALAAAATAQVSYKTYVSRRRKVRLLLLTLALFSLAQIGFFVSLTRLDVGVVYMSTGMIHVMVMAMSKIILGETITLDHWIVVALISFGLVLYSF